MMQIFKQLNKSGLYLYTWLQEELNEYICVLFWCATNATSIITIFTIKMSSFCKQIEV